MCAGFHQIQPGRFADKERKAAVSYIIATVENYFVALQLVYTPLIQMYIQNFSINIHYCSATVFTVTHLTNSQEMNNMDLPCKLHLDEVRFDILLRPKFPLWKQMKAIPAQRLLPLSIFKVTALLLRMKMHASSKNKNSYDTMVLILKLFVKQPNN